MTVTMPAADPRARIGGENFPVALAVLPGAARRHLAAVYAFARLVDDIGDEAPGPQGARAATDVLGALDAVAEDLDRVFAGLPARIPALRPLRAAVAERNLPRAPFDALLAANRLDQSLTDYRTRAELVDYCRLSADPVGRLVLAVFAVPATGEQLAASDAVCTALQIIEHLQDVGEDAARGRVYLPEQDRLAYGVTRADLLAPAACPALRRLVLAEARWAAGLLARGSGLVGTLHGWPRLAVAGYVAGGAAAVQDLRRRGGDPLSHPSAPRRADLARAGLRTLWKGRLR